MSLNEDELALIASCEQTNIGDLTGQLHAMYARAEPEERTRIVKLLGMTPTPKDVRGEQEQHNDDDSKFAEGARLADEYQNRRGIPITEVR